MSQKNTRALLCALLCTICATNLAWSYPQLGDLSANDIIFKQFQTQLEHSYRTRTPNDEPVFYTLVIKKKIELFAVAARLNIPYDTIASLNHLERARSLMPGERITIANSAGLFIASQPKTDLELLLSYRDIAPTTQLLVEVGGKMESFYFVHAGRFSSEERASFLGMLFRFPLARGSLSSGFGLRVSPITHKLSKHPGVDLAAPKGTHVFAVREGQVTETGFSTVLGNYIVIAHPLKMTTIYGHLSKVVVAAKQQVNAGTIIGEVGSTGESTGPHLHFEVRLAGNAEDPRLFIPINK